MYKIELLGKSHDRDGFDCGSEPLNLFLKQTARQHAERGISRTFVLVDEAAVAPKPILGFFALNICQIKSERLAPPEARKLPRDVSGVRLGRLAVAKGHQRHGIGKTLLVAAMGKFLEIFNTAGGIGLFVDAKDQNAKRYYEQFGFIPLPSNELELFLPVRTIQEALATRP
ncbi:MAG: GNAT family N-acetyltransferase [Verrucomicrobiota bacterium]|nr:GNAT family N-acetyltransferase [Verrucomicrobiota bacterium]MDE3068225.1 GNAT family N-acetyltransferase [Verrucomicrobiota bacterium]